MTRTPMSGNIPAEIAERLSDQDVGEMTSREEREAVRSIIEDYLLIGWTYPRHGIKVADAGAFLRERLSEDELDKTLRLMTYGCGMEFREQASRLERICVVELPEWLRKNFPDLIEQRADELLEAKR